MNQTFVVSTMYRCDQITGGMERYNHADPVLRTTALGCKVLMLLQLMYRFRMAYVNYSALWTEDNRLTSPMGPTAPSLGATILSSGHPESSSGPSPATLGPIAPTSGSIAPIVAPDIYARPIPFTHLYDQAWPTRSIIDRRYGFVLIKPTESTAIKAFFLRPFAFPTWIYILATTFGILAPTLHLLGRWERKVIRRKGRDQEYSVVFTLLTVIGALFQNNIPPVYPALNSRRIAYATLLLFTYVIHAYYTSNLLSHLVNDKERDTSLVQLVDGDCEFIVLDSLKIRTTNYSTFYLYSNLRHFPRIERLRHKMAAMRSLTVLEAVEALKTNDNVALLSDFATINPYLKEVLDWRASCDLIEVDLITGIKEFLFTAKHFPLHEQFKVGILRIIETGVLQREKKPHVFASPKCHAQPEPRITFRHVVSCLIVLPFATLAALAILALEVHFQRKPWPYLD